MTVKDDRWWRIAPSRLTASRWLLRLGHLFWLTKLASLIAVVLLIPPWPAFIWDLSTWRTALVSALVLWLFLILITSLVKAVAIMLPVRVHTGMPKALPKDFILYLRSFGEDTRGVPPAEDIARNSFEDIWAAAFSPFPVIALRPRQQRRPSRHIVWILVGEKEWQPAVAVLAARAHWIVVLAGATPSLNWELAHVITAQHAAKVLILLRRPAELTLVERLSNAKVRWEPQALTESRYKLLQTYFPGPLPPYNASAIALRFGRRGKPRFVQAVSHDDASESLRLSLQRLTARDQ